MRKTLMAVSAVTVLVAGSVGAQPLAWVQKPDMRFDAKEQKWRVAFALNQPADVEVALADSATGKVIRHLAAGVLGTNAPPPFAIGACAQRLAWDGKDD